MNKLYALYIETHIGKNAKSQNPYDLHTFVSLNYFDGIERKSINDVNEIGQLFTKNNILIAFDGYTNFGLMQHFIKKHNLNLDFDQCKSIICINDLCAFYNYPVPKEVELSQAIDTYKKLMNTNLAKTHVVLKNYHTFWVCHGGERITNNESGKWLIFAKKINLNLLWDLIVANEDKLEYDQARVSTIAANIWGGKITNGVIELFYSDQKKAIRIGNYIVNNFKAELLAANVNRISFKTDNQTKQGHGGRALCLNII